MQLTTDQQNAMQALQQFFKSPRERVFILNGQAGTGKTTLVRALAKWLSVNRFFPVLLATTGRAAKVLSNKTEMGVTTLHSHIYKFSDIRSGDTSGTDPWENNGSQLLLDFGIRQNTFKTPAHIYIVDEASMISHEISGEPHTARFGSGSLLDDFMAYTEPNKIVFVGDACQLPPVAKTPISGALNPTFLSERYGVQCTGFELREIQRQKADNQILQMAGFFRKGIESASFIKYPKLEAVRGNSQFTVLHSSEDDLIKSYVQCIRQQGYKKQIMLTNSNWKCLELNRIIRSGLGFSGLLLKGDLLMVVQNSYSVPLANGDLAEVLDVREKGCRAGLRFLEVEVCTLHNNQVFKTLLLADFLNNDSPALPQHNFKALLIDFDQRMRNLKIKRKTNRYVQEMMTDPYLNALRAKYGYVITCHKAQGGEWLEVYLLIHKSLFALRDAVLYRWFYTALTRASDKVHIHRDWWVKEV